MIVDNNVIYTPSKSNLLSPLKEIDGILASNDLTIIRIYTKIPQGTGHVVSKTIFLNREGYDEWLEKEVSILKEKYQTLTYRRERFITGLEIYENHFNNIDIDIDDRDKITKIHNFIVNAEPERDRLNEFIEESVLEMRTILRQGVPSDENSLSNFHRVTKGYFKDPNPEDELVDFILMEDDVLTSLDNSIFAENTSILEPQNKDLEETFFESRDDRNTFYERIKAFDLFFKVYRNQKLKRLAKMKKDGFFNDIIRENIKQTKVSPSLKRIIDTVTDKTKVCLTCKQETSSYFCQNIDCESIHSSSYVYRVSGDIELNYLIKFYSRAVTPYRALSVLSNSDKEISLSGFASNFKDDIRDVLHESEYSLSFISQRVYLPKEKKIAILKTDSQDIVGRQLNFWECYQSGSKIYGIIQHAEEIKTPYLVSEVKNKMEERRRSFSIDIDAGYYKNKVMFVVADYYGQIESCKVGILDTSMMPKILLTTGLSDISDVIALYPVTDMPEMQDIMYLDRDKGISSDYEEDKKGRYLMPLLDLANMTKDEISESSDVYKAKKADFYRLSGGDIVYASSGNIYINKDENDSIFLGEGNIGVINYVTANETVNHKTYLHERANLYKNYFKGFMFNPNSSSFNFYKDFNSVYKKKYDLFMDICLKNNGIIDEVFPGKEKIRFYNKKTSITKSTTEKVDSYLPGNFQVYSLSQVTPFMFRELQSLPIVNRVVITLENTQGPTEKSRLNILESPKRSYNNSMSLFIPNKHKIEKDLLNVKQLIYNGIKMSGVEDEITVSMDILIDKSADTYDLTLFEEYLSENGIYVMGRRSSLSKPIAIKGYDFVSLIL